MEHKQNPLFIPAKTRFVAHRGLSGVAPENTLAAFHLAGQKGFWGIEADFMPMKDGELIIMHDDTVNRTTNGTGNVRDLTLTQIQALTIDSGAGINEYPNEKVPTLREHLIVCKKYGAVPVLELKGDYFQESHIDKIINIVIDLGMEETAILISFNMSYLDYIRRKNTKIHLQMLLPLENKNINIVKMFGNSSINTGMVANMGEMIKTSHQKGVLVNVKTINDASVKNTLLEQGIDMISTDIFSS